MQTMKRAVRGAVWLSTAVGLSSCSAGDAWDEASLTDFDAELESALPLTVGAHGPAVREANEYLTRYGYFPSAELAATHPDYEPVLERGPADLDVFDDSTERALRAFQGLSGLTDTGELTAEVIELMRQPRCGHPDGHRVVGSGEDKWAYTGTVWGKTALKYRFSNTSATLPGMLNAAATQAAIVAGMTTWQSATNLSFSSTSSGEDVVINYQNLVAPMIGQAVGDTNGITMRFDSVGVTWSPNLLQAVSLHEFGHAIGLHHSSKGPGIFGLGAVMWPFVDAAKTVLDEEDSLAANALYNTWEQLPGSAVDIGVNRSSVNGESVWMLGRTLHSDGYSAYQWNGSDWTERPGARGMRIAVDPSGKAWMIGRDSRVYRYVGSVQTTWTEVPGGGLGTDIGIGATGSVHVIGTDGNVWRLASSGSGWNSTGGPGNAVALDVSAFGEPWAVKSNGELWQQSGGSWVRNPRGATGKDVGLGGRNDASGSVAYAWVIGSDNAPWIENVQSAGPNDVPAANSWVRVAGTAVRIAAGRKGRPYLVNSSGSIFRRREL